MEFNEDFNSPFDSISEERKKEEKKIAFNKSLIKAFIYGFIFSSVLFVILVLNGTKGYLYYIVNSFFVVGVVLACIGALSAIKKEGLFDIIEFGFIQLGETIKYSFSNKDMKRVDADLISYKERKQAERIANWPFFIAGVVYIVISFIALMFV